MIVLNIINKICQSNEAAIIILVGEKLNHELTIQYQAKNNKYNEKEVRL